MTSGNAYHVTPADGGEWAVKAEGESRASSVHSSQADAVAALELVKDRDIAEVVVHGPDGLIRSSLTIRQIEVADDREDIALRGEAQRITPGIDALLRLTRNPSAVGADLEADPADLYR